MTTWRSVQRRTGAPWRTRRMRTPNWGILWQPWRRGAAPRPRAGRNSARAPSPNIRKRWRCTKACATKVCCRRPMKSTLRSIKKTSKTSSAPRNDAGGVTRASGLAALAGEGHFPTVEICAKFAGVHQKNRVARARGGRVVEQVNRASEDAAGADAGANLRKQVALQIEEIADQVVALRRDGELAPLQVGEQAVDRKPAGMPAEQADGNRGRIHGGDLPPQPGEVQRVAAGPAREIERARRPQQVGSFHQQGLGREIEVIGFGVVGVPIVGHGSSITVL